MERMEGVLEAALNVATHPGALAKVLQQIVERVVSLRGDLDLGLARLDDLETDLGELSPRLMELGQQLCSFEDEVSSNHGELLALVAGVRTQLDVALSKVRLTKH